MADEKLMYIFNDSNFPMAFRVGGKVLNFDCERKTDTGILLNDGYTPITKDEYGKLCESKVFNSDVKSGKLKISTTAPETAQTKIEALSKENAELKAQVKKSISAIETDKVKELKKKLAALTAENTALKSGNSASDDLSADK